MDRQSKQPITIHLKKHTLLISLPGIIVSLVFILWVNASVFIMLHIPTSIKNRDVFIVMYIISTIILNIIEIYALYNLYIIWQIWRQKRPFLRIDTEGLTIAPRKEAHPILVPWEEIKWFKNNSRLFLTIRLRHPLRWWITYGHGKLFYSWLDLLMTRSLYFSYLFLDTPINDILLDIGQQYRDTLSSFDIQITYPRSHSLFRRPTRPHS